MSWPCTRRIRASEMPSWSAWMIERREGRRLVHVEPVGHVLEGLRRGPRRCASRAARSGTPRPAGPSCARRPCTIAASKPRPASTETVSRSSTSGICATRSLLAALVRHGQVVVGHHERARRDRRADQDDHRLRRAAGDQQHEAEQQEQARHDGLAGEDRSSGWRSSCRPRSACAGCPRRSPSASRAGPREASRVASRARRRGRTCSCRARPRAASSRRSVLARRRDIATCLLAGGDSLEQEVGREGNQDDDDDQHGPLTP